MCAMVLGWVIYEFVTHWTWTADRIWPHSHCCWPQQPAVTELPASHLPSPVRPSLNLMVKSDAEESCLNACPGYCLCISVSILMFNRTPWGRKTNESRNWKRRYVRASRSLQRERWCWRRKRLRAHTRRNRSECHNESRSVLIILVTVTTM